jgi:hypothetical protein
VASWTSHISFSGHLCPLKTRLSLMQIPCGLARSPLPTVSTLSAALLDCANLGIP